MPDISVSLPELNKQAKAQAISDLAMIARGDELDLPWRRLRVLLDHDFVRICQPVYMGGALRGSITSLEWTQKGAAFMSSGGDTYR